MKALKKQVQEKRAVYKMIHIYCRHKHKQSLCPECLTLYEYAEKRINLCPFMETKSFCSNCKVHCYEKDMQERIRIVMRYSGPRMLSYDPVMAIKHVVASRKERKK